MAPFAGNKVRVFLVDDVPLGLRLMERSLQFAEEEFEIVGTASSGREALKKIASAAPQLLITGLEMPQMDGIELTRRVRRSFPGLRVLVTSDTYHKRFLTKALRAGAVGYCEKASLVTTLAEELETLRRHQATGPKAGSRPPFERKLAEQMLGGVLFSSATGLAICDTSFRYQFINPALAAMNGLPPQEHINKTVRQVLGDFADDLEPKFRQVLSTGQALQNVEMSASTLPNRTTPGKWIEDYFPITDSKGEVTHIAIVVAQVSDESASSGENEAGAHLATAALADPVRIFRSWKEIASYASTSVRTAQRWERDFDLPVRRLRTGKGISVMAFKSDMDRWLSAAAQLPDSAASENRPRAAIDSAMLWEARIGLHHSEEPTQILRSWKEIARYLAVSVRAAQRWERELGLPVSRMGIKLGVAVVAFKSDLDEWLRSKGAYPSAAAASQ